MTQTSDMYSGAKGPVNIEVKTEHTGNKNEPEVVRPDSFDVQPRIDIIVDLEAPHARHNLNKLLFKLYADSPYLRIFVNKWSEWDDFSHKDNPTAPRATFFPGAFQVFLERKIISHYNMYTEKEKAARSNQSRTNASRMNSSHQNFVENETRESFGSQLEKFNMQKQSRAQVQAHSTLSSERKPAAGAEIAESANDTPNSDGEEDPNFNAEEIAFKVRLQCHKDRKKIVKGLVKNGTVHASEPSPEKKPKARRLVPIEKANNSGMNLMTKDAGLVVLKETAEPEEEEDTLEDAKNNLKANY